MKVLIADDCSATLEILRMNLSKWGYEPMLVSDGEQALRVLKSPAGPRLALLDWSMPKLEGVHVCQELRSRTENALNYTYIIVLTAKDGENNMVQALESGADDYLTKPVSTKELQLRVRAGERIIELQDRVVRMNRKLAVITTDDQLTSVLNRNSMMERLTQELERSSRTSQPLAFLTIDIDGFTGINDLFGFHVGDEILKQCAARFKRAIRSYDIVGRTGGEEFAIVLPNTDLGMGVGMAERVRNSIQDQPFVIGDDVVPVTARVGVASTSTEGMDRKRIVNGAEKAQREAKDRGGNRVMMWQTGMVVDPMEQLQKVEKPTPTIKKSTSNLHV